MKTLVVDDDVISRMALSDLLSGYGIVDRRWRGRLDAARRRAPASDLFLRRAPTMRRLNIGPEWLAACLNTFRDQIERGSGSGAKVRIDAMHAGCTTLGLWKVAATLDAARAGFLNAQRIENALAEIAATVLVQSERVKASAGATAIK